MVLQLLIYNYNLSIRKLNKESLKCLNRHRDLSSIGRSLKYNEIFCRKELFGGYNKLVERSGNL